MKGKPMICPETEVPCENNCGRQHRCDHWKDQGLKAPTKYDSKPTPTPSITVGTQVRLTGVVTGADGSGNLTVVLGEDFEVWIHPNKIPLEVIRQPFKRGEVVYFEDHDITCVVLEDEQNGRVLLIEAGEGKYATYVDAAKYERRP